MNTVLEEICERYPNIKKGYNRQRFGVIVKTDKGIVGGSANSFRRDAEAAFRFAIRNLDFGTIYLVKWCGDDLIVLDSFDAGLKSVISDLGF